MQRIFSSRLLYLIVRKIVGYKYMENNTKKVTEKENIIEVRNLYKYYKTGQEYVHALDGVDFNIKRGEFCAIVGPSGSGKSTLLNMLAGLEKPSKGEVIIAGTHIEKLSENQLVNHGCGG